MGKTKVIDKEMSLEEASRVVLGALQSGSITTAQMQQMFPGVIPLGDSRGRGAMWNLDLAVRQPLALAEALHIAGILDGREEGYDLITLTIPNAAAENFTVRDRITVPTGEVWIVSAVRLTTPADDGGTPAMNWRCSLWADRAVTPDTDGQAFHATPKSATPAGDTFLDEFHWTAMRDLAAVVPTNKPVGLRLPGGAVITAVATNLTAPATGDMECTLEIFGYVCRPLVDSV